MHDNLMVKKIGFPRRFG